MSRTIRRKNCYLRPHYVSRLEDVDRWALYRFHTNCPKRAQSLQAVRFHSDCRSGQWSPPSWYSRRLNKSVARVNDAELHRCLVQDCWDDHQPVRYIKNAGWTWW